MVKYRVNLYFHASVSYDVEAADEESAVIEAQRLSQCEDDLAFCGHLNLDYTDNSVELDEEN